MKHIILLTIFFASIAYAQNVQLPEPCDCDLEGILSDSDPAGANIREKPNGKILTKLISSFTTEQLVLKIKGHRNKWLKVLYDNDDPIKIGWVYGELMILWHRGNSVPLYSRPNLQSKVIDFVSETNKIDKEGGHPLFIIGCNGKWAFVKGRNKNNLEVYGWLAPNDGCSNPYTSCSP